jgi:hypothetical protein
MLLPFLMKSLIEKKYHHFFIEQPMQRFQDNLFFNFSKGNSRNR